MEGMDEIAKKYRNTMFETFEPRTIKWYVHQFYIKNLAEWDEKKYGKLYESNIKWKVGHLRKGDMKFLYEKCMEAEKSGYSFAKCFWGLLKVK